MLTLLLVVLLLAWLFSWGGPTYYPAYTTRYSSYPLSGNSSHILLGIVAILVLLWLLGYVHL